MMILVFYFGLESGVVVCVSAGGEKRERERVTFWWPFPCAFVQEKKSVEHAYLAFTTLCLSVGLRERR